MAWPEETRNTIRRLNNIKRSLTGLFTGRDKAVELLVLATVCQEHFLLVGPPGTAKTEIIQRYTTLLDTQGFHYLLTRFTEPSELFGPLDLEAFQKGVYHIRTENMLPKAEIVFLDEVFQGGSAILNALLTLLNERMFYNGADRQRVPLICMIGASNSVPDDPSLQAFADRFVLRLEVDRVSEEQVDDLLELGWNLERERIEATVRAARGREIGRTRPVMSRNDVLDLHARLLEVKLTTPFQKEYGQLIRELRAEGVDISDRRAVRGLKLIAGAALLRGADIAEIPDIWPVLHLWNRPEEAEVIRSVVQPRLAEAGGEAPPSTRPVAEIRLHLETLQERERFITSEAAWGAHLMALNKLRRELISDHPKEHDTYTRVEVTIQRALGRMENGNV